MTLPLPTTTITVWRLTRDEDEDGAAPDDDDPTVLAAAVPAHCSGPTGTEAGDEEITRSTFLADPIEGMTHRDYLVDDSTGRSWYASSVEYRPGLNGDGLEHMRIIAVEVTGIRTPPF